MIQDFLSPINLTTNFGPDTIGESLIKYQEQFPDLAKVRIAIWAIEDGRLSFGNEGSSKGSVEIRNELYALASHSESISIADLGNIKQGDTIEDTLAAIREVHRFLLEEGITSIVIGASFGNALGMYSALKAVTRNAEISSISSTMHLKDGEAIHSICLHQPNFLFNVNAIAYQSPFVHKASFATLEKMHFNGMRLGMLKKQIEDIEPVLRNSDLVLFDINAIRQADAPATFKSNPNGLNAEEACQIGWYSGISDKVRSFAIFEMNPDLDNRNQSAKLCAQLFWYFIEGVCNRKEDHPELHDEFIKYRCEIEGAYPDAIFYKSKRSNRWWMEVSSNPDQTKKLLLSCSYTDYQSAASNQIPERYFQALQKMH